MKRTRLQWIARPSSGGSLPPDAGPAPTWPGDPVLAPRDELIFLLHTASEIEHALMAQYLFAAWSVPRNHPENAADPDKWHALLMLVAKQEMGHLITVQNILTSLRAPITLDREDYPFRSELYPFSFSLERLSLASIAKYVLAEMPENATFPAGLTYEEVLATANLGGGDQINRVGLLFERLIDLVEQSTSDADFGISTLPLQARAEDWRADETNQVLVMTVASKDDALAALRAIAEQGEGSEAPPAGAPPSHFDIFARLYIERRDSATDPVALIPENPNTSPQGGQAELASGRIINPRSRLWALLGNLHYRRLLVGIRHTFALVNDSNLDEQLRDHCFQEMVYVGRIGGLLATLPQKADADAERAGMPLEMPYSLDFPDSNDGAWLQHRDLLEASAALVRFLEGRSDLSAMEADLLGQIGGYNRRFGELVEAQVGSAVKPRRIVSLRILPSLAIARFGSSSEPMDNYDLGPAQADGWHPVLPAETLRVDSGSGRITAAETPAEVRFRDANGLIKPACPFLEVWAQFGEDGPLEPLTVTHLREMGLTPAALVWQVHAANLKAHRRTGDDGDRITAKTDPFSDHGVKLLTGNCVNFKAGKSIPFGSVRYLEPTEEFPELRFRFTPAAGKVYGPDAGDPNLADDVYDAIKGRWNQHVDRRGISPEITEPRGIYARSGQTGVSLGYVDDACDAIIRLSIQPPGGAALLTATARVSAGPPHFSPDTLPLRTVADELDQWAGGPDLPAITSREEARSLAIRGVEIIRRALGTIRLMNTSAMNVGGMAGHDLGYNRRDEPIFPPAKARYASVEGRHRGVLDELSGIESADGSPEFSRAVQALELMGEMLREYDKVGDLSDAGRRLMPAMMRGADGLHLALSRRQRSIIIRAAEALGAPPPPPPPPPTGPEGDMLRLVELLASGANRHTGIDAGGGQSLASLFATPALLLAYLRRESVKTEDALLGQPLIVPGDPDASAFVKIIEQQGHPMFRRFEERQPELGNRTGWEVVRAWIASLTADNLV